jgi:hypothetical protein
MEEKESQKGKIVNLKKGDHLKVVTVDIEKSITEILRGHHIDPNKVLAFLDDLAERRSYNKIMHESIGELKYHETELILNHAELFRKLLDQSIKKEKPKHPKK